METEKIANGRRQRDDEEEEMSFRLENLFFFIKYIRIALKPFNRT